MKEFWLETGNGQSLNDFPGDFTAALKSHGTSAICQRGLGQRKHQIAPAKGFPIHSIGLVQKPFILLCGASRGRLHRRAFENHDFRFGVNPGLAGNQNDRMWSENVTRPNVPRLHSSMDFAWAAMSNRMASASSSTWL